MVRCPWVAFFVLMVQAFGDVVGEMSTIDMIIENLFVCVCCSCLGFLSFVVDVDALSFLWLGVCF